MKITQRMDLNALAERMGDCATIEQARALNRILVEDYIEGICIERIPEDDWLELCERAVDAAA